MPNGFVLGIEVKHLPRSIVIQHQLRPRRLLRALGGFGKGLVGGAAAVYDDAGSRSGTSRAALLTDGEIVGGKQRQEEHQGAVREVSVPTNKASV